MSRARTAGGALRRAFTLLEVMIAIVIIGILAAIVVPQLGTARDEAVASGLKSAVGGVRSSIAGFRANQILSGGLPYPTLTQLTTEGTVLAGELPENPINGLRTAQAVSQAQALSRSVFATGTYGWNYFVDNGASPPIAVFYANSDVQVGTNPDGTPQLANEQ